VSSGVRADDEVDPVRNGLFGSAHAVTVVHLDPTLWHIVYSREQYSDDCCSHLFCLPDGPRAPDGATARFTAR
jgi:hypothetical protein